MDPDFENRWRQARALENGGEVLAAKRIYQELIGEDPDRLYVRLRLSSIALGENAYCLAREHALACIRLVRTQRWQDLAAVARLLLSFDERESVRELIVGTDWTHPDIVRNSAVLSQYLWLTGEVELALRLIDTAQRYLAPNPLLLYSRATALGYLGRLSEATVEFERCVALNPLDAHAHWSLSNHQQAKPPDARVARVQAAQRAYPEDAPEQPFLHYALFKEFENAGDIEQAWQHLCQGASIKRKHIRYDPALEQEGFRDLQQMTGPEFFDRPVAARETGAVPIFIVGMPRSGTTLLERILGGSGQVAEAGELNDFHTALCIESNQFIGTYLTPGVLGSLKAIDFDSVGRCYEARTKQRASGLPFFSDKNPANFVHAGFIAQALPAAKILCLRRNPMDACMSNLKNLFANDAYGYGYDMDELADYYVRFHKLSEHWRAMLGDRYLEVEYERLVEDPMTVTKQVMDFCGLTFVADSIDITRNQSPVTTASSAQVRQPINRRSIGAWRTYEAHLAPLKSRLEATLGPLDRLMSPSGVRA